MKTTFEYELSEAIDRQVGEPVRPAREVIEAFLRKSVDAGAIRVGWSVESIGEDMYVSWNGNDGHHHKMMVGRTREPEVRTQYERSDPNPVQVELETAKTAVEENFLKINGVSIPGAVAVAVGTCVDDSVIEVQVVIAVDKVSIRPGGANVSN